MKSLSSFVNPTAQFFQKFASRRQVEVVNVGAEYASKNDHIEGVTWAKVQQEYFARTRGFETVNHEYIKAA